jgi:hypothetical protein
VFYVVGALYFLNTVIFALIPFFDWRRKKKAESEPYAELHGMVATNYRETYKISGMRSLSRGSLANGDAEPVPEYGATQETPVQGVGEQGRQDANGGWAADWQNGYQANQQQPQQQDWPPTDQQPRNWAPQNWQ